jgi:hypothetical protein
VREDRVRNRVRANKQYQAAVVRAPVPRIWARRTEGRSAPRAIASVAVEERVARYNFSPRLWIFGCVRDIGNKNVGNVN